MTSIIFKEFQNNNFSLKRFYIARFKRIVPALLFLCLVLFTLSYFFIYNYSFQQLIKELPSTLLFYSNFFFYASKQHYFSPTALSQWLLHTWSLSVEFQFYLFYPIILLTAKKFLSLNKIKYLVLFFFLVSLSFCLHTSAHNSSLAYYMLYTRAWQLLAGALVFLFPLKLKYNNSLQYLSVTLLIIFIFLPSFKDSWPNFISIIPILLAMLFLYSNANNSFLTKNKFLKHTGLWSYSIYLWHWPIIILLNCLAIFDSSLSRFLGITLSISCGAFSYYFIERKLKTKLVFITLITFTFVLNKYSEHFTSQHKYIKANNILNHNDHKNTAKEFLNFKYTQLEGKFSEHYPYEKFMNNPKLKLIVLGDCHAYRMIDPLSYLAKKYKYTTFISSSDDCLALSGLKGLTINQTCRNAPRKEVNRFMKILETTNTQNKTLLIIQRWNSYISKDDSIRIKNTFHTAENLKVMRQNVLKALKIFSKKFKNVFILIDNPRQYNDPKNTYISSLIRGEPSAQLLYEKSLSYLQYEKKSGEFNTFLKKASNNYKNIKVLDPTPYFCDKKVCPIGTIKHSYYIDSNHLTRAGSMRLKPFFEPYFKNKIF